MQDHSAVVEVWDLAEGPCQHSAMGLGFRV